MIWTQLSILLVTTGVFCIGTSELLLAFPTLDSARWIAAAALGGTGLGGCTYKFLFVQTGTNYIKSWFGTGGGQIVTSSGLDTDYPYREYSNTNTATTGDSPPTPLLPF